MANLRAIRTRIKGVESTRQITKSMKMVAAAKLRRTQQAFGALRDFADRSAAILREVAADGAGSGNPFLTPHAECRRVCYVLVVGNRGLCGTYNHALLRYLEDQAAADGQDCFLVVCGRWGKDLIPGAGIPIERCFDEISDSPTAEEARELTEYLRQLYLGGKADKVVLVYQRYKSVLQQVPDRKQLLPLDWDESQHNGTGRYLFEPDRETVLNHLVDLYLNGTVHATLLEARVGEHSSRMTAMTAAADNTEELIAELTLKLNHARQAAITTEISEIAGGAEALKNKR